MNDRADEIRSTRAPKLREDQIEVLRRYGETRRTEVGEVLIRAGDRSSAFIVVLEGAVEVIEEFAGETRTVGVLRAGRFVGELTMLTGQAVGPSAVMLEGGKVLEIPRERLKEVVTEEPNLSDLILKAFLARRSWGMRAGIGLRIIGSRRSGTRRACGSSWPATGCSTFGSSSRRTPKPPKPCSSGSGRSRRIHQWSSGRAKMC